MKKISYLFFAIIIYIHPATAQWSIDSISAPYSGLVSTQNGNKAIFASNTKYEIYNFGNGNWSTHNMLQPRPSVRAATAGGKSYFGGGGYITVNTYNFYNNVDIYNSSNNSWTTASLSQARMVGASAAVGNKVLFAGGRQILNYSSRVDIFDVTTGVRTTYNLSQARHNMAVAVVGTKVIFAGGETGDISSGIYSASNKVDIYDNATGTWSTATLTNRREQISVGVVGNKALFAGGINPNGVYQNVIDIYNSATNTWSVKYLSEYKFGMSVITAGGKVYFAGGAINNSGTLSDKVEIYNSATGSKTVVTISSPRMGMSVCKTPDRIMFAGGKVVWGNVATDRVEVLDLATNTWSVEYLSQPRLAMASAYYGSKAIFVGGAEVLSGYPQYNIISGRVDIWTDPILRTAETRGIQNESGIYNVKVFPNPFTEIITVETGDATDPMTVSLHDATGKLLSVYQLTGIQNEINLSDRKNGIYFLRVSSLGRDDQSVRIIKE